MMTWSLLWVLGFARVFALARFDLRAEAIAACFWQDCIVIVLFCLLERLLRSGRTRRALLCSAYGLAVLYTALNVPIIRLFATPLTWPMIRAAESTLSDSIWHHATADHFVGIALVLLLGLILPLLRGWRAPAPWWLCGVLGLGALLSWHFYRQTETHALHRNAFLTLLTSTHPRVIPGPAAGKWRDIAPMPHPTSLDLAQWKGAAAGRNIILILLESTGASYLAPYGAQEDPTPNLTALADRAILFEHAYAVYPESIKGLYSVLCSRYPAMDTRAERYCRVSGPALPALLRRAGYRTALFHSGRFMYLGMDCVLYGRGFDLMLDAGKIGGNEESSFGVDEVSTVTRMLDWIDGLNRSDRFFITYLPTAGHHPYFASEPGPFAETDEPNRYRNALYDGDRAIGLLFEGLKQRGLWDRSLLVIAGDHGEAFGEHAGNFGHTLFLFEENIRVPLLIAAPGLVQEQIRSSGFASLVDVAPTILDWLAFPLPPEFDGVSLLDRSPQAVFFFTDYSLGLVGLRHQHWKYIFEIESGRDTLFHLQTDPAERSNLAAAFPDRASEYRRIVQSASAAHLQTFRESASNRSACGDQLESNLSKPLDLSDAQKDRR